MYEVLRDALPEFLGSLGAALVCAGGAWLLRKTAARRVPDDSPADGNEQT
ncbi:hypothetical protein OG444_39885 (plasmid) [Streptomyces sp. NBC_01232]|nr:hypothetical protein OG444_39885 [Streptomyces sp. NBC_01232]